MFQADRDAMNLKAVSIPDTVVEPGKTVTLMVSNFGCEPVHLGDGEVVGHLEPATIVDNSAGQGVVGEVDKVAPSQVGDVAAMLPKIGSRMESRTDRLLSELGLDKNQREQLSCEGICQHFCT
jgi:hypothetical protein